MTDHRTRCSSLVAATVAVLAVLAGCSTDAGTGSRAKPTAPTASSSSPTTATTSATVRPAPSESDPDPRWQFFSKDNHWYRSPWFAGRHRIMIGFGCNDSPWYAPDARCPGGDGFHHGIDIAMPCGTPLRAGDAGVVLAPDGPGAPGAAYGTEPFRIRVSEASGTYDVLIAHADHVLVKPGEKIRRRQRLALASDSGAPDGCHLHFEVRPAGRGVDGAVDPSPWLQLAPG